MRGLSLNSKKSKFLVVSKKNVAPRCNIYIGGERTQQVSRLNYLGCLITEIENETIKFEDVFGWQKMLSKTGEKFL